MTRNVAIAFVMAALLACTSGCLDQAPGELSVRLKQGDQQLDAWIMLFNAKGVQIQEHRTEFGFVIIKQLQPATYYVKVKDYGGTVYPAVRKVDVAAGDSKVLDVDVNDTTQNPADAPAGVV